MDSTDTAPDRADRRLGRRALLGAAGLGVIGAGTAAVAGLRTGGAEPVRARTVAFHGRHQAGILHPRQAHARLAAFDFGARPDRGRAAALLLRWSTAAERLTRGEPVGEELSPPGSRAADTGAALGAGPASLTLTFGLGASFFDRVAMAPARPEALAPLPAFPDDQLDPARSGGDLFVQIAADDPLVTVHALRTLQRLAHGEAALRWTMAGFASAPEGASAGGAHRNLMGHLDGTANPDPADPARLARIVVSDPAAPAWRPDGAPDAGMLFLAWQSDPRTGFVPVQHRLARGDALARYVVHEASSLFVVPGGAAPGTYVGQALLEG
ncbi:Dyp-type peroxidase [Streptomyces sp. NPDC040724]|uniref:Dyp-type peroxidase n=1 Tax=Streptomyces sp. NPDC040724 TaxID=3155612 RepID=UPI0033C53E8F